MRLAFVALALALTAPVTAADARPRDAAACKPSKGKGEQPPAKKKKPREEEPPAEREPTSAPAPEPAKGANANDEEGRALQRGERVEFDARLIQGQTAKAGAVYLFARVPTNLKSMVRERTSFKEKIVRTVYPTEEAAP